MKAASFNLLIILLITLNVNAIPIHVRNPPLTGLNPSSPFSFGDSCNNNGREVYLINTAVNASISYVICKKTVGRKSDVTSYILQGKSDAYDKPVKRFLGCTVSDDGISTGFNVLWFSYGKYTPSDIRDASQALVNEASDASEQKKGTSVLMNYNTKRDILIDYIRKDGVLISNIIIPRNTIETSPTFFPRNRVITRAVYSFPYNGNEVPCDY